MKILSDIIYDMDRITKEQRSLTMSRIKSRDTSIELMFRKQLWSAGIRGYRVHSKLPGKPDIYFPTKKLATFIDGCFWHKCSKCYVAPKSKKSYWGPKIEGNVVRDKKVNKLLRKQNIFVFRIWEHELKKDINKSIEKFLKMYQKNT